jgi:hypothetical protein
MGAPRHARDDHILDDHTDPADLTPEQRLGELAAILAAGLRRLRARRLAPLVGIADSSAASVEPRGDASVDGRAG